MTEWQYDDGGRVSEGFKGRADDCVTRAIAIATGETYRAVYEALNLACAKHPDGRGEFGKGRSSSRTGVRRPIYESYLRARGWTFVATMSIGSGCRVHLRADELPSGTIIARLSKHLCTVIDRVIHDTHDPSRAGKRCVYGYYRLAGGEG